MSAWSVGDSIKLYRSENGTTWVANTPDVTCVLDASKVCSFRTDHLSYFSTVKTTTTSNGGGSNGWGGWVILSTTTGSTTGLVVVTYKTGSIINSPFSTELNNAYQYAYNIGITTMPTIQQANITGSLIRAHMAKMMVNYAIKVLGRTVDTWATCNFTDIVDQTPEMKTYIKLACQLGIMGVHMTTFEPNTTVTRAQFGTVLSRVLWGAIYNVGTPYYDFHLKVLKLKNIISNTTPNLQEVRGYVMLMLMRASK